MNILRENLLMQIGTQCGRCKYNHDTRILKLRTPLSRHGKGDLRYWTEVTTLYESDPSGFEVLCPNCIEVEKLNKLEARQGKSKLALPRRCMFSPFGYGVEAAWVEAQKLPVYFLHQQDQCLYLYPDWDKPIMSVELASEYYGRSLTDVDECVILERK